MARQNVSSGAPWEALMGYSRAVRVGPYVHVAGTTAVGEDGIVGRADAYAQTRRILEIITEALRKAGATAEQVVRTRVYVTDIGDWKAVARAHGEVFGNIRPATTLVEVAGLLEPDMLVEIEADAYLGD